MRKPMIQFCAIILVSFMTLSCIKTSAQTVGWAIGFDTTFTPVIVNTTDGGLNWQQQGDLSTWKGQSGCDISALDDMTAWAALGDGHTGTKGAILHTTDGGASWVSQPLPDGLFDGIKGIKGLSRSEAWAATLNGTILHTTDGGSSWSIVPHPKVSIKQVNRIDAQGTNVWIADAQGAIVHTSDIGLNWYAENLTNGDSPLTVHAYNPKTVWASGSILEMNPTFYRTLSWGNKWDSVITTGGRDHLDDICVADPDNVWGVQNGGSVSGKIWRIHMTEEGMPKKFDASPSDLIGYMPGGVTCMDTSEVWVVAQQGGRPDPTKPLGIILHKKKNEPFKKQTAPTQIRYWKISFVGARR